MKRYKVHVAFGPWQRADEFESDDEFHATLAAEGVLLTEVVQVEE